MDTITAPTVFQFNTHEVRTVIKDGVPWFVAADVCSALGYSNTSKAIGDHLDDDERSNEQLDRSRMGSKAVIISESGLYALVLRSRKPEARKFAKWVTSEVLPAIRKTGEYRVPYVADPNDVLTAAQAEQLRMALNAKCGTLPKDKQGAFMLKGWAKLKSHFGCAYRKIPQREFTEALSLVTRHAAEWELLDTAEPKSVDVRDLLLKGQSAPTIKYPVELHKEIDARAWEMAGEAFHLIRAHLERRVAYKCERSYPERVVNLQEAISVVREGGLGQALAHGYYSELETCMRHFIRAKDVAGESMEMLAASVRKGREEPRSAQP